MANATGMTFGAKLAHAWNAFTTPETEARNVPYNAHASYGSSRPDRIRMAISNERSIISAIYVRMSIDFASIDIRHVRLDEQGRYSEDIVSGLNNILSVEANLDQAARAFRQDLALTLFDQGVAALVPVDTTLSPIDPSGNGGGSVDILTMRIGEIKDWFPQDVRVSVYNEQTGIREDLVLPKRVVGIIYNPLYSVMNEPNSTLQRVITKLNMLDAIDKQSSSGKLDMIIQLPYVIKSETKREQAEQRRKDIEFQLKGSQYGIAYTDGSEKITQLNRPAENNMLGQIEYLMKMLYGQLGITEDIMNGTADEATMLNYFNRTIEPLLGAVSEEMKRKFLTKTARTQKQSIEYFRDPFKLVPMKDLAEMADKFTRNEIFSSNEFRTFLGIKPSPDAKADELRNSNMPRTADFDPVAPDAVTPVEEAAPEPDADPNAPDPLAAIEAQIDGMLESIGGV